ncbi:MAG TPA: hypothetical protein VEI06_15775 [Gemmatimonadaceae bacterium]|nr:hypothetical protein [Gemmatimonadaceae bacterium]
MRVRPLALALAIPLSTAVVARAQQDTSRGVRIGLTYQPGTKPAVVVLAVRGTMGDTVQAMLQRDLDYSDRVEVIGLPGTSAAATTQQLAGNINYAVWKSLGALAAIQVTLLPTGMHVSLHDVAKGKVAQEQDFTLEGAPGSDTWRLGVHAASDEVERWITGTRGIAQSRILYVRGGRIYVVDTDGADDRAVSDPGTALSPAWSPSGRLIAYSVLTERGWRIALRDLTTGQARWLATASTGLNVTPVFSPDGNTLVYAHGEDAGTDLVAVDLASTGPGRRITVGRGTDNTSPTFSPDSRRVAFTSGRSGHPEVYMADADGSNAELLTAFDFGDQNYRSNPDWSPDGRQIAFQSQINGQFQVMTINLRDRSVRQLTSEGINEDPAWAPDSRHLVFTSTRSGTKQLFVIDAESGRTRQLTHAGGSRLAAWSRILAPSSK